MRLKILFSSVLIGLLFCTSASFSLAEDAVSEGPAAFFPEPRFTFKATLEGTEILHDFVVMNKGTSPLDIQKVKSG